MYQLIGAPSGIAVAVPDVPSVPGDFTGDGVVDIDDLLAVISAWGPCPAPCPPACDADISPATGDCQVNIDDLLMVVSSWGSISPPRGSRFKRLLPPLLAVHPCTFGAIAVGQGSSVCEIWHNPRDLWAT